MKARHTNKNQKIIAPILGFISALVIVYSGFVNALIAFFLVGAIPGTSWSVSPIIMLLFFGAASWLLLFHFVITKVLQSTIGKLIIVSIRQIPDRLNRWVQRFLTKAEAPAK